MECRSANTKFLFYKLYKIILRSTKNKYLVVQDTSTHRASQPPGPLGPVVSHTELLKHHSLIVKKNKNKRNINTPLTLGS